MLGTQFKPQMLKNALRDGVRGSYEPDKALFRPGVFLGSSAFAATNGRLARTPGFSRLPFFKAGKCVSSSLMLYFGAYRPAYAMSRSAIVVACPVSQSSSSFGRQLGGSSGSIVRMATHMLDQFIG